MYVLNYIYSFNLYLNYAFTEDHLLELSGTMNALVGLGKQCLWAAESGAAHKSFFEC